jgi:DNA-binding NarL/FixJ family response regulator
MARPFVTIINMVIKTRQKKYLNVSKLVDMKKIILAGRLGIMVYLSLSGAEAIESNRMKTCDLILMACRMPEMDGYHRTKRIKELFGLTKKIQSSQQRQTL